MVIAIINWEIMKDAIIVINVEGEVVKTEIATVLKDVLYVEKEE
mgnify:CR=1 FL=1